LKDSLLLKRIDFKANMNPTDIVQGFMMTHIIIKLLTCFAATCGMFAMPKPADAAEIAALGDVIT